MTNPRSNPDWSAGLSGSTALIKTPLPLARPRASARSSVRSCNCNPNKRSALVGPGFLLRCARFGRRLFLGDLFESFDTFPNDIGGNGESEPLSRNALRSEGHLRRADPDKAAGEIDQRTTAVPRINRGVRLEQVVVIVVVDRDLALHAAENAPANRATVAERVADHDDGLAKADWARCRAG